MMRSAKRRRPPDSSDEPPPKQQRIDRDSYAVVASPPAQRPTGHLWRTFKGRVLRSVRALFKARVKSAVGALRTLLFINYEDEAECLKLRGFLQSKLWSTVWLALHLKEAHTTSTLADCIERLKSHSVDNHSIDYDAHGLQAALSSLLAYVIYGGIVADRPLAEKLSPDTRIHLNRLFDHGMLESLASSDRFYEHLPTSAWFRLLKRPTPTPTGLTTADLAPFRHTAAWRVSTTDCIRRMAAYEEWQEWIRRSAEWGELQRLTSNERRTRKRHHEWGARNEHLYREEAADAKSEKKALKDNVDQLLYQTRKYRLFPNRAQIRWLKNATGTCRWTYNQALRHFRKTGESNAAKLQNLYVSRTSATKRHYPPGYGPPPDWAYATPENYRQKAIQDFASAVKTTFTNLEQRNITHFKMHYRTRRNCRFYTLTADKRYVKLTHKPRSTTSRKYFLSIPGAPNIAIRTRGSISIDSAVKIVNSNGCWYAAIPHVVEPSPANNTGTCIALDPGIKAFFTGCDLQGNIIEIGRGTKARLERLRSVKSDAQRAIATFKKRKGRTKRWHYKKYVHAKRAFNSATARMKNLIRDLHRKACAFLVDNYQTIILPVFKTKEMVRRSCSRNHNFNTGMLSLNHYQFRMLLKAKCEARARSLVVCSEMYTSRTCGACKRLHLTLRDDDVFVCPHCGFTAGRDANAAFNILRFVSAGSLQTLKICN